MTETVADLQMELNQARSDLRQTSREFRRRLEPYEFRLQDFVGRKPLKSVLLAAGLGFALGRASRHSAVVVALAGGMLAGFALAGSRTEKTNRSVT